MDEASDLSDLEGSSGAETEPLNSPQDRKAKGKRAAKAVDTAEDDEPLPKEYGHTRPIKEIKARRRAAGAGSDSSLTDQDSDSTDRPIASSSLKVPPTRRAGLRKTASEAAPSDVSEASEADERVSTSPDTYRPRAAAANKSRRRKPPQPVAAVEPVADESEASGLPTPVSPPPAPVINGKKRRRGEEVTAAARNAKAARLEKKRSISPVVPRGKLKEPPAVKIEEQLPPEEPEIAIDEPVEPEPVEAPEPVLEPEVEAEEVQEEVAPPIELALDPVSDKEEDPLHDPANRARLEAMEELVRIEIKFAKVREALFLERSEVNNKERQTIEDGTHPEMLQFTSYLDEKQSSRLHLARQMYVNTERMIVHQVDVDERNVWRWWEDSKLNLRSELLLVTQRKRRRYDRDRTFGGKWDKAEEGDKYREIYEDHSRRRMLTEEMAEAEYQAESAIRDASNGISPLPSAAIQTDLEAMSLRSPAPTPTVATYPALYTNHPSMGPYNQMGPSRSAATTNASAPAPYIAAASQPPMAFIPQPRTMPSPLSAAPFPPRASLASMETFEARQPVRSPPTSHATPQSPVSAGKAGHAHRPSLDAHMERKAASTPNSFQSRFILPPIPPFAGGTRTHSGSHSMGSVSSASHASSSATTAAPVTTSAPVQKPVPPEMPAFRFPAPQPAAVPAGNS